MWREAATADAVPRELRQAWRGGLVWGPSRGIKGTTLKKRLSSSIRSHDSGSDTQISSSCELKAWPHSTLTDTMPGFDGKGNPRGVKNLIREKTGDMFTCILVVLLYFWNISFKSFAVSLHTNNFLLLLKENVLFWVSRSPFLQFKYADICRIKRGNCVQCCLQCANQTSVLVTGSLLSKFTSRRALQLSTCPTAAGATGGNKCYCWEECKRFHYRW